LLSLRSTEVTNAGLKNLIGLKSLRMLYLEGTKVTDAGVKELQTALPACGITR
jgi:internalin A